MTMVIKFSENVIIVGLLYPFVSLIFLPLLKHKLSYLNLFMQGLVILATIVWLSSRSKVQRIYSGGPILGMSIIGVLGSLFAAGTVSFLIQVIGLKYLIFPVVASMAFTNNPKMMAKVLKAMVVISAISDFAALVENIFGVKRLVALGFNYGTNIIQFTEGTIRAPGLSLSNFDFGFFSALVSVICFMKISGSTKLNISRRLVQIGFVSGLFGIGFSLTRNALIFLIVACVYPAVVLFQRLNSGSLKLLLSFLGVTTMLALGTINTVFVNTSSLHQRLILWQTLYGSTDHSVFYGLGLGKFGAASFSSLNTLGSYQFVDNYFLSIFFTAGLVGLFLFIAILGRYYSIGDAAGRSIIWGYIIMSLFTESWEYTEFTTLLLGFVLAHTSKDSLKEAEPILT